MTIPKPIAFAGAPLDLAEHQRSAAELTAFSKAKNARALILHHGAFLVGMDGHLALVHPQDVVGMHLYDPGPLFLGMDGERPLFCFSFAKPEEALGLVKNSELEQLRSLALTLTPKELALAGRGKSLFDWHRAHQFCANCGNQSNVQHGGLTRKCPNCETDHFPRVNPVVIMLVINGDKVLLGRGPEWPEGAYSALAGFVSPGESLSEACKREVLEEVGINVHDPVFKFSQPWPFPSQLMMGLFCHTKDTKITLDIKEVVDAQWFSKDVVRGVFDGTDDTFFCPPPFTIAYELLQAWLEG